MTQMPYNPSKLSRDCVAVNRKKPDPPPASYVLPPPQSLPLFLPPPLLPLFLAAITAEVEVVAAEVASAAAVAAAAATWQLWQRQRQMR
jgi:hypothetical protein